jgi:hypothetical protein
MEIGKESISYPDFEDNPREASTLTAENPKIIGLSKSIEKNGLKYGVILYTAPWLKEGMYGVEDGDRRCIACFDILGWDKIPVISVSEYKTRLELRYAKLVSNWDREQFSGLERGRYCFSIMKEEMASDGLDIDENWGNRTIRSEYLNRLSSKLAKSTSIISRSVNAWRTIPIEDRGFIANSPEEIKMGKLSTNKALKILTIARKTENVGKAWRAFVPPKSERDVKPPMITTKELEVVSKMQREGIIVDVKGLQDFRGGGSVDEWTSLNLLILRDEEKTASIMAAKLKVDISKVWRVSVLVASKHIEEMKKLVGDMK